MDRQVLDAIEYRTPGSDFNKKTELVYLIFKCRSAPSFQIALTDRKTSDRVAEKILSYNAQTF